MCSSFRNWVRTEKTWWRLQRNSSGLSSLYFWPRFTLKSWNSATLLPIRLQTASQSEAILPLGNSIHMRASKCSLELHQIPSSTACPDYLIYIYKMPWRFGPHNGDEIDKLRLTMIGHFFRFFIQVYVNYEISTHERPWGWSALLASLCSAIQHGHKLAEACIAGNSKLNCRYAHALVDRERAVLNLVINHHLWGAKEVLTDIMIATEHNGQS